MRAIRRATTMALAYIGMKLGERWETDPRLKLWFHRFDVVIVVAILAGAAAFLWSRWAHRIRTA